MVKVLVAGGVGRLHAGKQSLVQGIDDGEERKPVKVGIAGYQMTTRLGALVVAGVGVLGILIGIF